MQRYVFKKAPESWRAVFIATCVVLLQAFAAVDLEKLTDWRAWLAGVLVGVVHAAATAALGALTKRDGGGV